METSKVEQVTVVSEDGRPQDVDMVFSPMEAGNCRYQLPGTEEWSAQMLEKIRYANKQR